MFLRLFKKKKIDNKQLKLLLHLCCGPCGAAMSGELKADFAPTVFFSNSNLDSRREFVRRLKAAKRVAAANGLPLVVDKYDHAAWLEAIKGHEDAPERGSRCLLCYRYRLRRAAQAAAAGEFDMFTSSLVVSPYKDGQAVIHIGREVGAEIKPKFLDTHFGQTGGWQRAVAAAKKLGLYRQKYCGCEFSKRQEK